MIWDEKRQCWWMEGECHRPRRRDNVVGLVFVVAFVLVGIAMLIDIT